MISDVCREVIVVTSRRLAAVVCRLVVRGFGRPVRLALIAVVAFAVVAGDAAAGGAGQTRARRRGRAKRTAGVKVLRRVDDGTWGGRGVRLDVGASGARLEFDCAHGRINGPFALDRAGRFEARGTYTREGGPARVGADVPDGVRPADEGAETFEASYAGRVEAGKMTLSVTLSPGGARLGPFRLARGEQATLVKCH
jgi:hypothetical protein